MLRLALKCFIIGDILQLILFQHLLRRDFGRMKNQFFAKISRRVNMPGYFDIFVVILYLKHHGQSDGNLVWIQSMKSKQYQMRRKLGLWPRSWFSVYVKRQLFSSSQTFCQFYYLFRTSPENSTIGNFSRLTRLIKRNHFWNRTFCMTRSSNFHSSLPF